MSQTSPVGGRQRGTGANDGTSRKGGRVVGWWDRITSATFENPILVKEFRTRMRGTRAYWMLLGYTLLLASTVGVMYFFHESSAAQVADSSILTSSRELRELGRNMFFVVLMAQSVMVALITPAITAGTITIEREQRSYELLVTTPLLPGDVIRGKLSAAVSFVVLLLTASLPLVSLSFLVGGVSPAEIFFSYVIIALSAFVYGALGIFWSAALKSTAVATVVSYLTVLGLFVITLIPAFAFTGSAGSTGAHPELPFQSFNPVAATLRAVQPEYFFKAQIPSWISGVVLNLLLGLLITEAAMSRLEHFDSPRPAWIRLFGTLFWGSFCLFLFAPIVGALSRGWTTSPGPVNEATGLLLQWMLVLACLTVPLFNTGDLIVRRGESALARYLEGFLPHRMLRNDLSCGFPLSMLWGIFLFSLIPAGIFLCGKSALFHPQAVFLPGAVLALSVVFGLAGVGHFLSVTVPSRWAACILSYLVMVCVMALPGFTLLMYSNLPVPPREPQALWQLLYLMPEQGLSQLTNPVSFWTNHPAMAFGSGVPIWLVTTAIYLIVGAVCFALTAMRVQQQGLQLQRWMEAQEKVLQGAAA